MVTTSHSQSLTMPQMQGYQTLQKQNQGKGGNKPSKQYYIYKIGLLLKEQPKLEVVRNYYFTQIFSVQQYL